MHSGKTELAQRKELVLAQSALYRAQLRYQVMEVRARWKPLFSVARTLLSIAAYFRK